MKGLKALADRNLIGEYRRRLDAAAVLEHYAPENCSERPGEQGSVEILHSCLIDRVDVHHSNGDARPSASMNLDLKLYCCYSGFWQGDLLAFIAKMEGKKTVADALGVIEGFLSGATATEQRFSDEIDALLASARPDVARTPAFHDSVLAPWAFVHPYLTRVRGITVDAAHKLVLGFDEGENRIVFPHFWHDTLVGWQKRVIPAGQGWPATEPPYPKYRNSVGLPKATTLYNYDRARRFRTAVVVESPMSVAKAVSLGLDNAVATFGAKITDAQIALLRDFDTVWVWFDADPAGAAGQKCLVRGLHRHTEVRVVTPDKGADLGDCDRLVEVMAKIDLAVPAALADPQ